MTPTSRRRQGRLNQLSGAMAEDCVVRDCEAKGMEILARRHAAAGGELDIVARDCDILVFIEVKRRRKPTHFCDAVSPAQWRRLEAAANQYISMATEQTGAICGFRFDVAFVGPDSVPHMIENARSFDEH